MSGPNLEEAAAIATEYISSLENLPSEVHFLLTEIQHLDTRTQDLLQDTAKESAKYIRHSGRAGTMNPKDATIPQSVKDTYDQIDQIADEKLILAQRIVDLIARAKARLDHDLSRVLVQQGEEQPNPVVPPPKRHPVHEIRESLRSAIVREATPVLSSGTTGTTKRRKLAGNGPVNPINLPSPAPSNVYTGLQRSSRLASAQHSRQSPFRPRRPTPSVEQDEDAEGEEEVEDGGEDGADPEDKTLYCFCQKLSYGEMIGCDNEDCRYQWFHLGCVGLKAPLPENWYCPDCSKRLGKREGGTIAGSGAGRKGRKK